MQIQDYNQETLYTLALYKLTFFMLPQAKMLYTDLGSATEVFNRRRTLEDIYPEISPRLKDILSDWDAALRLAESEMEYDRQHNIRVLCYNDDDYPLRLRECDDAPLVLFYTGNANLNKERIINIIGTRRITVYGQDMIASFVNELHNYCPDTLIVSGLAYGVDINAHRSALKNRMETVGVLAHGLDDIYPSSHRSTANEMVNCGGLLSEYFIHTNADKMNFVRRNRIVAGMSDACILIESAEKGGGLITAELSQNYNRDVYAFPGRANDRYSAGCNKLIRENRAGLITNAMDFVKSMHWDGDIKLRQAQSEGIEATIFPQLNEEEKVIVNLLSKNNDLQINVLSVQTGFAIPKLTNILFQLEMKGVIKVLAGGMYHLISTKQHSQDPY